MTIKVYKSNVIEIERNRNFFSSIGTFLYKFPSSNLREKSNGFIPNKNKSDNSSFDTAELLTNLVKTIKHQNN